MSIDNKSISMVGRSIIPRLCACGCNKRYFSPMWKVTTTIDRPRAVNVYDWQAEDQICSPYVYRDYYSCKEYPSISDIPIHDTMLDINVGLNLDYELTDDDWAVIRETLSIMEFLDINYNIHIFPLTVNGIIPLRYVALCVQEIPEIIAIGSTYELATARLKEKMTDWFETNPNSNIPKPEKYDPSFKMNSSFHVQRVHTKLSK